MHKTPEEWLAEVKKRVVELPLARILSMPRKPRNGWPEMSRGCAVSTGQRAL